MLLTTDVCHMKTYSDENRSHVTVININTAVGVDSWLQWYSIVRRSYVNKYKTIAMAGLISSVVDGRKGR